MPVVMAIDGLFAGIDTTAHTMAFLMYNLATNSDKQDLLYKEIREVIGGPSDEVTEAHLNKMRYLKACLAESMRRHATTVGYSRQLDVNIYCTFIYGTNLNQWFIF